MRIAIDARYVADHFPGIGRYVYNLVSALAGLPHAHTLVVLHNSAIRNTRHDIAALAQLPGVELVATSARPFTLAEQVGLPRLLGRVGADLYHAPYYVRPYVGLPCRSVVTLYDVIPRRFPSEVSRRARLLFDLLTRLAIRASQQVIAISASSRTDLMLAYGLPADRIAVTPLAADPRFRPTPPAAISALRSAYDLPEQYVLSLASNKPHKNLPRLIAAWAEVVARRAATAETITCPLVVAGHWDARYQQARQIVAERHLEAAVRFLPDVAEADLPALYGGALLFVFPSLYEGFGLPPLEAMACGTPVICSNTSSLPEVVGDSALLLDPTSVEQIVVGLARLLDDAALRDHLRTAGLRRAATFSWAQTAAQTLVIYEQT
jgi:glycosyltransferase involved in cell wall biosynthesis